MTDQPKRGRGRPPLPADERRTVRVPVRLTLEEAEQIDALRGETDRATYLRERGLQLERGRKR